MTGERHRWPLERRCGLSLPLVCYGCEGALWGLVWPCFASLPAVSPLRRVANGPGYTKTLALYRPLAALMPRHPQIIWNLATVAGPHSWRCLAEIFARIFFALAEIPRAGDGSCNALFLAVIGPDSLARPNGYLSCKIVLVAWWQVKRDVPMLAVMVIATACVFACPYAGPRDAAMDDPLSQHFEEISISIPQVADVKNTARTHSLYVSCIDG